MRHCRNGKGELRMWTQHEHGTVTKVPALHVNRNGNGPKSSLVGKYVLNTESTIINK